MLLFLSTFLLFSNTLGHEFVFDDVSLITQNPVVTELKWGEMWSVGGYRPVRTFTYGVNYLLGGNDPFGYHLFNVLLHAINGLLVFFLIRRWSGSNLVAGATAFLFASHPVQTAAVAYVSGRKDLLAGFFILAGCLLYTRYRQASRPNRRLLTWSLLLFIPALLSKEVAVVYPLLLLLLDTFLFFPEEGPESGRGLGRLLSRVLQALGRAPWQYGCFAVLGVLAVLRILFVTQASRMVGFWGGTVLTNLGTSLKLFGHYLKLVVFPYPLVADYTGRVFPVSSGFSEWATLLSLGVLLLFLAAMIWAVPRYPLVSLGGLWFLITLLPVLHIIPFHEIAADHFLYVPSLGVALAAGVGLEKLARSWKRPAWAWGLLGGVLVVYSAWTVDRNRDWKNPQTLWEATLRQAPASFRANSNLANIYFSQGRREEALRLARQSLELDPARPESWKNLGTMYYELAKEERQQGNPGRAEALLREAVSLLEKGRDMDPWDAFVYSNLGSCYKEIALIRDQEGKPEAALQARKTAYEYYEKGLELGRHLPYGEAVWYNLGNLFVDAGLYDQALFYFRQFEKAFPDSQMGQHYWIGYCHYRLGDYAQSVAYLEKAVAARPTLEALGLLAKSYEVLGENTKAIEVYQRALKVQPSSVEAYYNLGVLYHRIGELEQASRYLQQALALRPPGALQARIETLLEALGPEKASLR